MAATRNDVAKRAGVSSATVSHVINETKPVSPLLRERVMAAVRDLQYVPNRMARSMKTRKSMQVGLVLSNLENPIFADLVQGFEKAAETHGYTVNIFTAYENSDNYLNRIINTGLDGVLVEPLPRQIGLQSLSRLLEREIKLALFSHTQDYGNEVSHIRSDYDAGMRSGLEHLRRLGHSRIAYVSGFEPGIGSKEMRYAAFQNHSSDLGLDGTVIDTPEGTSMNLKGGRLLGELVLDRVGAVSGIICTNDLLAMGIIAYLQEHQVSIPRDLSVIGIDNNSYSGYFFPRITSIGVDYFMTGARAFSSLFNDIHGSGPEDVLMPMCLVVRDSTAAPTVSPTVTRPVSRTPVVQ